MTKILCSNIKAVTLPNDRLLMCSLGCPECGGKGFVDISVIPFMTVVDAINQTLPDDIHEEKAKLIKLLASIVYPAPQEME